MNPEQAASALEDAVRSVLEAISPDGTASLADPDEIPCGGLGGNEFTKISTSLVGGGGKTTDDADTVLTKAEAEIERLGLSAGGRQDVPAGPSLVFTGDGFGARLVVEAGGGLMLSGQTDCLPHPEG